MEDATFARRPGPSTIASESRKAIARGAMVFDPVRLPQAGPDLFDPASYRPPPQPVHDGGRGAAWFVHGPFGEGVLRHSRRGGLVAHMVNDRYLYLGERRVRSFHEFRLLARLRELGLPVPAPLAAACWRAGAWYRAALLVERIPGTASLAQRLAAGVDAPDWEGVGRLLAAFHRAGVQHADLNAHNILVDAHGRHYLIDFDRGRLRRPAPRWRKANLARLWRSLRKLRGTIDEGELAQRFERLRRAYAAAFGDGA